MKKAYRKCAVCGRNFTPLTDHTDSTNKCPECAAKAKGTAVMIRTCVRCGKEFEGFPAQQYCSSCAYDARLERQAKYRQEGVKRHIGDTDICERCGKPYTVRSGLQKYCPDCQRQASLEKQRERKRSPENREKRKQHKKQLKGRRQKICVYCGRVYNDTTSSNTCSLECREAQKRLIHTRYMYNRGKASKNLLDKYESLREQKINEVKKEQ